MIVRTQRPLSSAEREQLEREIRASGGEGCLESCVQGFLHYVGGAVIGMLAAALLGMLLERLGVRPGLWLISGGILVGFAWGARCRWGQAAAVREARSHIESDLAKGWVESLAVDVEDALKLGEGDDEGPAFFLD